MLCVVLVGSAYLSRRATPPPRSGVSSPAASVLQPLFERCDEEPTVEAVDGIQRTTCTMRQHPTFMIYSDVSGEAIERAGLMVPMHGRAQQYEERKLVGLELFTLMAGVPAESFLPADQLANIGAEETRFTREGLVYLTLPLANVGLVFTVMHASDEKTSQN